MRGTDVCRTHGAKSLIGSANPAFKHGRYGKYFNTLPPTLRSGYVAALNDPDLLSLESEIATLQLRVAELNGRVVGSCGTWQEAQGHYNTLIAAMQREDQAAIRTSLLALRDVLFGNVQNDREWREWTRTAERLRRLIESERRRLLEADMYLSREQAHSYAHALLDAVTRHVHDREILLRISHDIRILVTGGNPLNGTVVEGAVSRSEPTSD